MNASQPFVDYRQQLVFAATTAAGPVPVNDSGNLDVREWHARVTTMVTELALMSREGSPIYYHLEQVLATEKPFVAVLMGGEFEETSKRLNLHFQNAQGEVESLRTARLDTPEGESMAKLARSLKGRKVRVYKLMEQDAKNKNRKYRVLKVLQDLGPADGFVPTQATPPPQPQFQQPVHQNSPPQGGYVTTPQYGHPGG